MIALYRKYRPQTFAQIVVQNATKETLTHAIESNRVVHSYLFAGPRGTGKTTMARVFAKALNCENREEGSHEPCNTCTTCNAINSSSFVDLIEIDAASNRGIDEIRNLKEAVRFSASKKNGYKIYIIDESHMLTKEASNALLKTLEEPPHNVIFILATTDPQKMLPTIHSRVQRFDFTSLTAEELRTKLQTITEAENVTVDSEVITRVVMNAMGGARDAESLLGKLLSYGESHITSDIADSLLGTYAHQESYQLLTDIGNDKPVETLQQLHALYQSGHSMDQFIGLLIKNLRYVFLASINDSLIPATDLLPEERDQIITIAKLKPIQLWGTLLEALESRKSQIHTAYLPHLPIELAIVESCVTKESFAPVLQVQGPITPAQNQQAPAQQSSVLTPPPVQKSSPRTSEPQQPPKKAAPTPLKAAPINPPPAQVPKANPFRSTGTVTTQPLSPKTPETPDDARLDFLNKPAAPKIESSSEISTVQESSAIPGELSLYTVKFDLNKVTQKLGDTNKTLVPMMGKIKPVKVESNLIYFELSSPFFKSRLEKCSPDIIKAMEELWSIEGITLKFVEPGSVTPQEIVAPETAQQPVGAVVSTAEVVEAKPAESLSSSVDDIFGNSLV